MGEVGAGLCQRADGEMAGHEALAKAGNLREDEPHPVAALGPGADLGQHLGIAVLLRGNEAFQVEFVRARHALYPSAGTAARSRS